MDATSGEIVWQRAMDGEVFARSCFWRPILDTPLSPIRICPPALQVTSVCAWDGNRVIVGDTAKKVSLLDAASGDLVWQKEMGGVVRAEPAPPSLHCSP